MTENDTTAAIPEGVVVPLDEPSMEDYPPVDGFIPMDEFGAPPVRVVKIRDGVKDTVRVVKIRDGWKDTKS